MAQDGLPGEGNGSSVALRLMCIAVGLPFFALFSAYGDLDKGFAAYASAGLIFLVAVIFKHLRKMVRYWLLISALSLIHLALTIQSDFRGISGPLILIAMPAAIADLMLMFFLFFYLEKKSSTTGED